MKIMPDESNRAQPVGISCSGAGCVVTERFSHRPFQTRCLFLH
ncbi:MULTISPECIES: hypothetical protein [unclassified Polaromonas]|jgi:hypothetical protein|nr:MULTISPECIES: hypothetical protein [unclassified Polaromonas]MBG6072185.1 hypothetical protein [Polaromonas sp. CG_9.7]MBG6114384.1 hypothetical protein [Polaromonas sp. CG_9.2]MDH6182657.1 hypothetical protein [Polaromonas sp. CG_23.6]